MAKKAKDQEQLGQTTSDETVTETAQYKVSGLQAPGTVIFRQQRINLSDLSSEELGKLYEDGCRDFIKKSES